MEAIPKTRSPAAQRPHRDVEGLDPKGFRPNVGMVLTNSQGQVLWARRVGQQNAWQFPQGGIAPGETPIEALYRELYEEVGLRSENVEILGQTQGWLRYRLPKRLKRSNSSSQFRGQKQKWFLLRLISDEAHLNVSLTEKPEFDHWKWVSYWYPLRQVVSFKRQVYRRALKELAVSLIVEE